MPMAVAIVIRVLALRLDCIASRLPVIPSRISLNPPINPPADFVVDVRMPMNFLRPRPIAANNPALNTSEMALKLILVMKSRIALEALSIVVATNVPIEKKAGPRSITSRSITLPKPDAASVSGLNRAMIRSNECPMNEKSILPKASAIPPRPLDQSIPAIPETTVLITPTKLDMNSSRKRPFLRSSSIYTRKSPMLPVTARNPEPTGAVAPTSPNKP